MAESAAIASTASFLRHFLMLLLRYAWFDAASTFIDNIALECTIALTLGEVIGSIDDAFIAAGSCRQIHLHISSDSVSCSDSKH